MLVYGAGGASEEIVEVRHLGKRLIVALLDLLVPPRQILEQIGVLASLIVPLAQAA